MQQFKSVHTDERTIGQCCACGTPIPVCEPIYEKLGRCYFCGRFNPVGPRLQPPAHAALSDPCARGAHGVVGIRAALIARLTRTIGRATSNALESHKNVMRRDAVWSAAVHLPFTAGKWNLSASDGVISHMDVRGDVMNKTLTAFAAAAIVATAHCRAEPGRSSLSSWRRETRRCSAASSGSARPTSSAWRSSRWLPGWWSSSATAPCCSPPSIPRWPRRPVCGPPSSTPC